MSLTTVDGIVLVRNNQPGPTIFQYDTQQGKGQIEWGGAGDIDETDVQEVPDFVLRSPDFRRAVARGILTVIGASDEYQAQVERAAQRWVARQDAAKQGHIDAIDPMANNDLIGMRCQGPGLRGQCEETVMVMEKIKNAAPILCQRHSTLADQFVLEEDPNAIIGDATGGKAVQVWRRTGMTAMNAVPSAGTAY